MTVLPSSSQVVYTIDSVRYTCYDNWENREIARLIVDKEHCDSMITVITNELVIQQNRSNSMQALYIESKGINDNLFKQLNTCSDIANEYRDAYIDTSKKLSNTKIIMYSSIVLNLLLTTIILL